MEKTCSCCKKSKPVLDFFKSNSSKDGYRYQCKECHYVYQQNPIKRAEWSKRYYAKRKENNPQLFMWKQALHRAKYDYNNMEFTISVEDIIIPEQCPYFQTPFIALDKNFGYSLDRIDSSKGYTKDNIQVISRLANIMKNNATIAELVTFAKGVLALHTKGGSLC